MDEPEPNTIASFTVECTATVTSKDARRPQHQDQETLLNNLLAPAPSSVWHVSFSRDGKYLATCHASPENCIRIWSDQVCVATLEGVHERTIRCTEFGPNYILASASFDSTVCIWDHDAAKVQWECSAQLEGHENEVKSVAWNRDGSLLATCGRDKSVWIWECSDGEFECVAVLNGHDADVKHVTFMPKLEYGRGDEGDEWLVSTSYDNSLKVWADDDGDWYCVYTLQNGHDNTVWDVAPILISDKSPKVGLVSAGQDGSLSLWEFCQKTESCEEATWKLLYAYKDAHSGPVYSVHASSTSNVMTNTTSSCNTNFILSAGGDDAIHIYEQSNDDSHKLRLLKRLLGSHQGDVNCVRWNPVHKSNFVSSGDDGKIKFWTMANIR